MNNKYTAQATTQEEAIEKGLNALGITKEEAIITIEEPGKKGFFGLGQRDAVVVVEKREKIDIVDEFLSQEFDKNNLKSTMKTTKNEEKIIEKKEYISKPEKNIEQQKAKDEEKEMSTEEFVEGRDPSEVEKIEKTKEKVKKSSETELEELNVDEIDEKAIDSVRTYLRDVILAMGISDVEVYTSRINNNVKYDIETENAGMVIGRHGKVLNGLQILAQNHMHQLAHSKLYVRVDAEKYRDRRKNTVETLAKRTASKVVQTKKPIKLNPMPAHERKQIHRFLSENSKVTTHSEGKEPKRYLVIEPEN